MYIASVAVSQILRTIFKCLSRWSIESTDGISCNQSSNGMRNKRYLCYLWSFVDFFNNLACSCANRSPITSMPSKVSLCMLLLLPTELTYHWTVHKEMFITQKELPHCKRKGFCMTSIAITEVQGGRKSIVICHNGFSCFIVRMCDLRVVME